MGTYTSNSTTYTALAAAVKTYADGFVNLVATYTPSDGQLSEQYLRATGVQTSAVKLTWSFAAALTAFDARANYVPASWGASGVKTTCSSGGGGGGGGSGSGIAVTFNEVATTVYGVSL